MSRHGTYAEAQQHRRRGEKPCDPCREAENAYNRMARQRPSRSRSYALGYVRAQHRALARLRDAHRAEYERYLDDEYARAIFEAREEVGA